METSHSPTHSPELIHLRERLALLQDGMSASIDPAEVPRLSTELEALATVARFRSDARPELRQILILQGRVACRRGDGARGRDLLIDGLAMDAGDCPPDQRVRDHYFLASIATDLKNFEIAAEHYGKAAAMSAQATGFDANQRLGIRERHAFALHEAKRFADALEVNRRLLEEGERLLGAGDHRLSTVLVNAAQNLYALRRVPEAESFLQRALTIAQAQQDIDREQDLLYQLAVLASEQGKPAAARACLAERLQRLEKRGPIKLQEAARRSLEHFDRNQARS